MFTRFRAAVAVLVAAATLGAAQARADVAWNGFEPRIQQSSRAPILVLNGAGTKKVAFFDAYAIGLYLERQTQNPKLAINAPGHKRISIQLLRDTSSRQILRALQEGIERNSSEQDRARIAGRLSIVASMLDEIQLMQKGTLISLDWIPHVGTVIKEGRRSIGSPIPGEDFYRALLRIWLGDEPSSEPLKAVLLGQQVPAPSSAIASAASAP